MGNPNIFKIPPTSSWKKTVFEVWSLITVPESENKT